MQDSIIISLLVVFVAMWISAVSNREGRWAMFYWVPVVLTSGLGTLLMVMTFMAAGSSGPSAEGGFHQLGLASIALLLIPCPLILLSCLLYYPRPASEVPPGTINSARSKVRVVFRIQSDDQAPVVGVRVAYTLVSRPENGQTERVIHSGSTVTNAQGRAMFFTYVAQECRVQLTKEGYVDSEVSIKDGDTNGYEIRQIYKAPFDEAVEAFSMMNRSFNLPMKSFIQASLCMLREEEMNLPVVSKA